MILVRGLALVLSILAGPLLMAEAQPFKGQTLRVQFWGGDDGTPLQKHIVDPFVKATGANVVVEYGNTSASIAKARAQKNDPQVDVMFLDDFGVLTLAREGILDKLDLAKMPHAKEIDPSYIVGDRFGIGFFNYIVTIMYNDKLVNPPPKSWRDLWDARFRGKMIAPPVTVTNTLMFVLMAARLNGGSLDNLAPAWPKLIELKPNIHSFVENRTLRAEAMKSGEAVISVDLPSSWKPFVEQGYPVAMANPEDGFFSVAGAACILKGSKANRDLVYAFIDQALTAEAQSGLVEDRWFGPTNPNVRISAQARRFTVHTPEQYKRAIQVDRDKLLEARPKIIDEWNKIFAQ